MHRRYGAAVATVALVLVALVVARSDDARWARRPPAIVMIPGQAPPRPTTTPPVTTVIISGTLGEARGPTYPPPVSLPVTMPPLHANPSCADVAALYDRLLSRDTPPPESGAARWVGEVTDLIFALDVESGSFVGYGRDGVIEVIDGVVASSQFYGQDLSWVSSPVVAPYTSSTWVGVRADGSRLGSCEPTTADRELAARAESFGW
ncbi:MAG: hypothetical protein U0Q07_05090 [Acidimicrobiales bacterium]